MVRHQIRGRRLPAVLLALSVVLPAVVAAQAVQRSMFVSVTDKDGAPVPGLGPSDFVIREDRSVREVLKVEPATEPMHLALLVDNSQAAEPYQRDLREAVAAFITAVGADAKATGKHQIALITLASRPTILNDYSPDQAQLLKNALRLFSMPDTGTYLLDGIIETSAGIIKRGPPRPVIVAITTEGPELSDRRFQSVLQPLRESGAALYVISIGQQQRLSEDRSVVIDQGTRITGGRFDNILVSTALPALMKQLARELTDQYLVTYARQATTVPPELVTVSVNKPGLTARGRLAKEPRAQDRR